MHLPYVDYRSKKLRFSALLWAGTLTVFVAYLLWGPSLITDAYYQRSFSILNDALSGRADHTLAHYVYTANRILYTGMLIVLIASLTPYIVTYVIKSRQADFQQFINTECSVSTAAAVFGFVLLASLIPFAFVTYLPLNDYPFHIARSYILNSWNDVSALQDMYDIQSFILPNMGMDFSLLLIGKLLPIQIAGRVFVALIFGLTLGGCLFLHKTIHGRLSLWPLVSSFFLFNGILLFGFINYLFGLGLLLWAVALWIRAIQWTIPRRVIIGTLLATGLFFAHLVSVGLFGVIVAGYELQRSFDTLRTKKMKAAADLAAGASIFIVPALLFLMSPTSGETNSGIVFADPYLWSKVSALSTLFSGYASVNTLQLSALALSLFVIVSHGKFRIERCLFLPLLMLVCTYFLMPRQALSAGLIDYRLPIVLAFFIMAGSNLEFKNRHWQRAAGAGMVGFLLLRSLMLSSIWAGDEKIITEYTDAFQAIPTNSILFVATGEISFGDTTRRLGTETPVNHLGSLAMIERRAFVPAIYAHPSQQPISVKNRFNDIKEFQRDSPIRVQTQQDFTSMISEIKNLSRNECQQGRSIFLLMHDSEFLLPDHATLVASGSRFSLLKVQSC